MAMRAGFLLDRIVAADRNRGVPASHRLPGGRVFSRNTAAQTFPGLRRQGLTGAAVFYDYVTTEPDRLTFSFAHAAVEHGAVLVNYLEAVAPRIDGRRVTGVSARDTIGSRTIDVAARMDDQCDRRPRGRTAEPLGITTGIPMLKR
jgi:Glycerol-3-phosphate dehydrogenase